MLGNQLTDDGTTLKLIRFGMRVTRRIGSIAEHCETQEVKSKRPNGDIRQS